MTIARAYKVLTADQWEVFGRMGRFEGAPVDLVDGFVHLSTAEQLDETISKHFAGQSGLIIVEIALESYGDEVRWETSRGGALFPHVYGPLRLETVTHHERRDA